ncbi:RNA-binding protein Hfq [Sulfitobacter sp. NAS-14.1]|nr:RNA-binding protein Hfq [Sulfitobacter sp. NAS-14.1]
MLVSLLFLLLFLLATADRFTPSEDYEDPRTDFPPQNVRTVARKAACRVTRATDQG